MTVAKTPRSCEQPLPAWPLPPRPASPVPREGWVLQPEGNWLAGWQPGSCRAQGDPRMCLAWTQVGSGFPSNLGPIISSLAAAFSWVRGSSGQASRPDSEGLPLGLGKMLGGGGKTLGLC